MADRNQFKGSRKVEITNPLVGSPSSNPQDTEREAIEAMTSQINKRDANPEE